MASPAAVLSILVKANTAAANAALAKTSGALRGTAATASASTAATSRAGSAMRTMGTAAKVGGAALAIGFVIEAKRAVDTTQDLTKSTITLQKNLGLTAEKASAWGAVAKARDVDATKLGMAFKTLSTQVEGARAGSEESVKSFKKLGIGQRDLAEGSRDVNSLILKVSDGMKELGAGTERTAITSKLFGRGWQTISPLMRDGSKALKENLSLTEKYGATLEGKTLKDQKELLANTRESKIAWMGLQVSLAKFVTPALNEAHDSFQKIASILANDKLSDDERWKAVGDIIGSWSRKALDMFVAILPTMAEKAAEGAPKIAMALVQGFINADAWGKVFLGAWFIKKLGGFAAISALGSRVGTVFGTSMATTSAAGMTMQMGSKGGILTMLGGAGPWAAAGVVVGGAMAAGFETKFGKEVQDKVRGVMGETQGPDSFRDWVSNFTSSYDSIADAAKSSTIKQREAWIAYIKQARQAGDVSEKQADRFIGGLRRQAEVSKHMTGGLIGNILDVIDVDKKWEDASGKMKEKVVHNIQSMFSKATAGFAGLGENANKMLKGFDARTVNFGINSAKAAGGAGFAAFHQRGGPINLGKASGDSVPAMLERGEYVLNRNAVAGVGKDRLDAINFGRYSRFAKGGGVGGGLDFALGPYSIPPIQYAADHAGSNSHVHVTGTTTPWVVTIGRALQRMGFLVGEHPAFGGVTPGVHSPTGGHYDALAIDINSAAHLQETRGEVAQIARLLGGKGGAAMIRKLKRVILQGPKGGLRDMGQGALDKVWKAGNAFLAKQAPVMGMEGVGAGATGPWVQVMKKIASSRGWSFGDWMALVQAESSGNPNAVNPSSGATGLGQMLGDNISRYNGRGTPAQQIAGMAAYISDRYGNPSSAWAFHQSHNWYRRGGGVPYLGAFDSGGIASMDGLGMLKKGELMVPPSTKGKQDRVRHLRHSLNDDDLSAKERRQRERELEIQEKLLQETQELRREIREQNRIAKQTRGVVRSQGKQWMVEAMGEELGDLAVRNSRYAGNGRNTALGVG